MAAPETENRPGVLGDPLGCAATVFDPADHVDEASLTPLVDSTARSLGAELHVRVEGVVDGGLDDRLGQVVAQCPGWDDGAGDLADDLIVVIFSPTERESAVYYGSDHADLLEDRWESVVDAMTIDLRAGDYDEAIEVAMSRLDSEALGSSAPADDGDSASSSDFPFGWVLLLIGIVIAGTIYRWYRGDAAGGDDGSGSSGGSSWHRRSFSSSGSSRRRSGGGGRRSSSRSSGRAGGGSKKW